MHFTLPLCVATLLLATCLQAQAPAATPEMRNWTDTQGRTMQATLKGVEGTDVIFQMATGQTVKFPIARLSAPDQEFVKKNGAGPSAIAGTAPPAVAPVASTRIPIEKRIWPTVVEVDTKSIDIKPLEVKPEEKRCVYQSDAFEFISEDKLAAVGVVREIARTFEATLSLVKALPWGVEPMPPADLGRYQAKFYETRDSYLAEGGPPNSGGVYFSGDRVFRIPFESLGLKLVGKTWAQDRSYRNDTIIHEITHQLMHDYLSLLPTWIIEGTAEYVESIPYNAGTFQAAKHESGLKDYVKQRAESENMRLAGFRPIDAHMKMTRDEWDSIAQDTAGQHAGMRQLYFQSYVMVYYFCHLDGDGKGTRFLKYFDAMAEERAKWADYELKYASYRKEMEEFFKLPGVKKFDDGRFTYPNSLTPPARPKRPNEVSGKDFGLEKLDILYDGRSGSELEAQMKEGFRKIGVKW